MDGPDKDETLPPGFRFHPTDEELITFYLIHKLSDPKFTGRAIADVDLNKCEPWDLPGKYFNHWFHHDHHYHHHHHHNSLNSESWF